MLSFSSSFEVFLIMKVTILNIFDNISLLVDREASQTHQCLLIQTNCDVKKPYRNYFLVPTTCPISPPLPPFLFHIGSAPFLHFLLLPIFLLLHLFLSPFLPSLLCSFHLFLCSLPLSTRRFIQYYIKRLVKNVMK